jgi:hypothetical protein
MFKSVHDLLPGEATGVMPRYFFNLVRGARRLPDREGVELDPDDLDSDEVAEAIKEVLEEQNDLGFTGWSIEITDESGEIVAVYQLDQLQGP